jgi:hypothetical protein
MVTFQDTCINSKGSNPFVDDGFVWCRLKCEAEDGYFECEFDGRWNECPEYMSMRQAMKGLYSHVRRTKAEKFRQLSEMSNDIDRKV